MPYIFSTTQVTKSQVFTRIKELLIAAGWSNVSSNPATDFDVFKSTGKDGTKDLVFQIRSTNMNNTEAIETVLTGTNISLRLVGGYTPGAAGAAGTFAKNPSWYNVPIVPRGSNVTGDTLLTLQYYADKNMMAFVIQTPLAWNLNPCIFFLGLPDETYCSEPNSRGLLYAPGFTWNNWAGNRTGGHMLMTDSPGELAPLAVNSNDISDIQGVVAPNSPNSAGKFIPGEFYYGNGTTGMRGKFPCFYFLPRNENLLDGDTIQQGATSYKVYTYQASAGYEFNLDPLSPFPAGTIVAIQVS